MASVNILIAGDAGAGKTTLINTFISNNFSDEVATGTLEVRIPMGNVSYRKHVTILDCQDNSVQLEVQLRRADCVLLLLDCTRAESMQSLVSSWLPLLRDTFVNAAENMSGRANKHVVNNKTAVIAFSKTDLISPEDLDTMLGSEKWTNILKDFPFVACVTSCSSKALNVKCALDMAARLASWPLWPLYDSHAQQCTPEMWRAFKRIFRIHDRDLDGLLSDSELNSFQRNCQWDIFKPEEFTIIKKKIQQNFRGSPGGSRRIGAFPCYRSARLLGESEEAAAAPRRGAIGDEEHISPSHCIGLLDDKITFDGFFSLVLEATCRDLNLAVPWTALQRSNYDLALKLEIPPEIFELPKVSSRECLTLSTGAVDFLLSLVLIDQRCSFKTDGEDARAQTTATHSSSDSESEYLRKIKKISANPPSPDLDVNAVPLFLEEALSVLDPSLAHPWLINKGNGSIGSSGAISSPSPRVSGILDVISPAAATPSSINTASSSSKWAKERAPTSISRQRRTDGRRAEAGSPRQNSAGSGAAFVARVSPGSDNRHTLTPPYLFEDDSEDGLIFYLNFMKNTRAECRCSSNSSRALTSEEVFSLALQWVSQWHMLVLYRPHLVKKLLYCLGYEHRNGGVVAVPSCFRRRCEDSSTYSAPRLHRGHLSCHSTHLNVVAFGGEKLDNIKSQLVALVCELNDVSASKLGKSQHIFSSGQADEVAVKINVSAITAKSDVVSSSPTVLVDEYCSNRPVVGCCHLFVSDAPGSCQPHWEKPVHNSSPFSSLSSVFICFTGVPASESRSWIKERRFGAVDVAVLLFIKNDDVSLSRALEIDRELPPNTARLFVEIDDGSPSSEPADDAVWSRICAHTATNGMCNPFRMPVTAAGARVLMESCLRTASDKEERGIPVSHRSRGGSMWKSIGKGVGVGGVVALTAGFLLRPDIVHSIWSQHVKPIIVPSLAWIRFNYLRAVGLFITLAEERVLKNDKNRKFIGN